MKMKLYKPIVCIALAGAVMMSGCGSELQNKDDKQIAREQNTEQDIKQNTEQNTDVLVTTTSADYENVLDDILQQFNFGETTLLEARTELDKLLKDHAELKAEIDDIRTQISKLDTSKQFFKVGLAEFEKGNYDSAADYLSGVVDTDINYAEAQAKLKEAEAQYKSFLQGLVECSTETGDFAKIRAAIDRAKSYLDDDVISDLMDDLDKKEAELDALIEARKTTIESKIASKISEGDYRGALSLCSLTTEDPVGFSWEVWYLQKKSEIEELWVDASIKKAEELLSQGLYDEADGALNSAYYNVSDISRLDEERARINTLSPTLFDSERYADYMYTDILSSDAWAPGSGAIGADREEIDNIGQKHVSGIVFHRSQYYDGSSGSGKIDYYLGEEYDNFKCTFCVRKEDSNITANFILKIYGDGKLLYTSNTLTGGVSPIYVDISVSEVTKLTLEVSFEGGERIYGALGVSRNNADSVLVTDLCMGKNYYPLSS